MGLGRRRGESRVQLVPLAEISSRAKGAARAGEDGTAEVGFGIVPVPEDGEGSMLGGRDGVELGGTVERDEENVWRGEGDDDVWDGGVLGFEGGWDGHSLDKYHVE